MPSRIDEAGHTKAKVQGERVLGAHDVTLAMSNEEGLVHVCTLPPSGILYPRLLGIYMYKR